MNGIFTVKVNERTLRFKFTFRTAKAFEEETGVTLSKFEERFNEPTMADIEMFIKYGLLWKNKNLTEDELLDILDEAADAGKLDDCLYASLYAYIYFFKGPEAVKILKSEKKRLMEEEKAKLQAKSPVT